MKMQHRPDLARLNLAISAFMGVLVGCGGTSSRREVVGAWVYDAAGSSFPDPKEATLVSQTGPQIGYDFKSNGSFTEEPGHVVGSYRVDGKRLFLKVQRFEGVKLNKTPESGLIFLSDDGSRISIYSRDDPPEIIALKRAP